MSFRLLLYPFAILYGIIVYVRNRLFDWKILSSTSYNTPIISVGNISTGGTGKTPMVEYLISLLKSDNKVATLSRGYKRTTKHFIIASKDSKVTDIGDEPAQIKNKFPDILVAVDNKRVNGINNILDNDKTIDTIILDDAYQHRWVQAGISIVLIDYNKPLYNDHILPAGNLRECKNETKRADIIIITKCPDIIDNSIKAKFERTIKLKQNQSLFYSKITYSNLKPVFDCEYNELKDHELDELKAVIITGIANPDPLAKYLSGKIRIIKHIKYEDHHNYTRDDIENIISYNKKLDDLHLIIITTEKDSTRFLKYKNDVRVWTLPMFYVSIDVEFLNNDKETFNNKITDYVKTSKRHN